ncbi:MAG: hypothetical protein HT580_10500 [Dechloromonas sp.]|nr:MAG: hypothetical protein HT580_10500 [Dechloromonas sp.]
MLARSVAVTFGDCSSPKTVVQVIPSAHSALGECPHRLQGSQPGARNFSFARDSSSAEAVIRSVPFIRPLLVFDRMLAEHQIEQQSRVPLRIADANPLVKDLFLQRAANRGLHIIVILSIRRISPTSIFKELE